MDQERIGDDKTNAAKRISMELQAEGARVTGLSLDGGRLVLTIEAVLESSHLETSRDESSGEASASARRQREMELHEAKQKTDINLAGLIDTTVAPPQGILATEKDKPSPQDTQDLTETHYYQDNESGRKTARPKPDETQQLSGYPQALPAARQAEPEPNPGPEKTEVADEEDVMGSTPVTPDLAETARPAREGEPAASGAVQTKASDAVPSVAPIAPPPPSPSAAPAQPAPSSEGLGDAAAPVENGDVSGDADAGKPAETVNSPRRQSDGATTSYPSGYTFNREDPDHGGADQEQQPEWKRKGGASGIIEFATALTEAVDHEAAQKVAGKTESFQSLKLNPDSPSSPDLADITDTVPATGSWMAHIQNAISSSPAAPVAAAGATENNTDTETETEDAGTLTPTLDESPAPVAEPAAPDKADQVMSVSGLLDPDPADSEMSEESNVFGGERHGEPHPAMSFGDGQAPAATTEAPEAPAVDKAMPPKRDEGETAQNDKDKSAAGPEPGSTTVLIRYTCPKCKTQGMQAVDKVGTVVNCSNCGKAMRLVMKK